MMYQPFHELFPTIAEKETRAITLFKNNDYGLPPDDYLYIELFCSDPKCDCRRAMFRVYSLSNNHELATICWGWESTSFYIKWLGFNDKKLLAELKGPALNAGSHQSNKSTNLLQMFSDLLLTDSMYIQRVKRHYSIFKRTK